MRKIALIGGGAVAAVVLLAVGVGVFLYSSLDSLVKKAIETVGTEVAGVPVSVSEVQIKLGEGKASIKGLSVGNPKGFTAPHAFRLGEIAIALDTGSVTGNPIVIKDISVASPEVTYETGAQGSNIDAIQRNIAAKTGGGGKSEPAASSSSSSDGGKKLVIDRLALTGGTLKLATPIPGAQASAKLGDIVLTGIGRSQGGASSAQVAEQVLGALTKGALKSVQNMGLGGLVDGVAGKAGSVVPGGAGDALKGVFGK
jgi:hypothetical protein